MKALIAGGGTGGHLMPSLAIGTALRELGVDVVLVGAERGLEATLLPEREFPFHLLPTQPLYRKQVWKNARWPVLGVRVMARSRKVLAAEHPDIVVGTGGYASGPLLLAARLKGRPIALQEQNAYPGLATRLMARHSDGIFLGYPEAAAHLNTARAEVFDYGNPIVPPPATRKERATAKEELGLDPAAPVVMVMGGSQGSVAINRVVARALNDGKLHGCGFIWSTGENSWNEFSHFATHPNTAVRAFWDPISDAYAAADVVVSRSGAMSTADFCAWGLPAILIPLPTAAEDHQTPNALALEAAGAARHLPQKDLTPATLVEAVLALLGNRSQLDEMRAAATGRARPDSARRIASQLVEMMR
jgi:UDP-N-acetylglucosamine--N-acetylmuramyl-(pentapeptide) pyrophosphoryl-undecaprenol N-acetylglucosamine transferase